MNSIIVCSLNDPAGTNIRERLIEAYDFKETEEVYDNYPVYSRDQATIVCSQRDIVFVEDVETTSGMQTTILFPDTLRRVASRA